MEADNADCLTTCDIMLTYSLPKLKFILFKHMNSHYSKHNTLKVYNCSSEAMQMV